MAPQYTPWSHQMSDSNYLKHLHTALYVMKYVRFLAEYTELFLLALERAQGVSQNFCPSKIIANPHSDWSCRCQNSLPFTSAVCAQLYQEPNIWYFTFWFWTLYSWVHLVDSIRNISSYKQIYIVCIYIGR